MPTVTFGDNSSDSFSGCNAAQIKENTPTTNYISAITMDVSKFAAGDWTNALIEFPTIIDHIPSNAIITNAILKIWLGSNIGGSYLIAMRRMLRNWSTTQVTWNEFSTGNAWTTAGAMSDGNDRVGSPSATGVSGTTTGVYISLTGAGLITDVQQFLIQQFSYLIAGWHLERSGGSDDGAGKTFASDEGTNGQRPILEVTYELPTGFPFITTIGAKRI